MLKTYQFKTHCKGDILEIIDDNAVQPVIRRTARPGLRSENSQNYYIPRARTKLGERVFSYAGPVVWNNNYLPMYIGAEPDITLFKNIHHSVAR